MRISDWSSDVCSSDLQREPPISQRCAIAVVLLGQVGQPLPGHRRVEITAARQRKDQLFLGLGELVFELRRRIVEIRSEVHTSELQSLMRISYAVFCLKKKT